VRRAAGAAALLAAATLAPPCAVAAPPEIQQEQTAPPPGYVEEKITIPLFGRVKAYRPEPLQKTQGVVLFVSGDGGWKLGVVDMARRSADRAIVVGLSFPAWKKVTEISREKCWLPAGDLESTAQTVEKIYKLPRYLKPILVGFSSGATVVYGALAQAPDDTFAGAISLGFCNDVEVARPWCPHGDWRPEYGAKKRVTLLPPRPDLAPRPDDRPRWTILQGTVDKVCDLKAATEFAGSIPAGRVVSLPGVGHGFSVERNWGDAYDKAIADLLEPVTAWDPLPEEGRHVVRNVGPKEIRQRLEALDLPLEVQWPAGARQALIFVSGDGGWAELDQRVAAGLTARGIAVIGWNALRYFWQPKTPGGFRADLARVLEALPEDVQVLAGGYSFGAEVVPAALVKVGRLDPPLSRIAGLVLIAPGPYAAFEVSPLDWLRTSEPETEHSVPKALTGLEGLPLLCLEPSDHAALGCPDEGLRGLTRVILPGGHHFSGDYEALAGRIIDFLKAAAPRESAAGPSHRS
jgi:type IV secretory pathway VirJ component